TELHPVVGSSSPWCVLNKKVCRSNAAGRAKLPVGPDTPVRGPRHRAGAWSVGRLQSLAVLAIVEREERGGISHALLSTWISDQQSYMASAMASACRSILSASVIPATERRDLLSCIAW